MVSSGCTMQRTVISKTTGFSVKARWAGVAQPIVLNLFVLV
ncbi:hypothetical protein PRUB_b0483 [Pseudoalteromonas rubra]|uniref:Uncharacterized protein n=1 Tax=Pseudoalteromonas rubra TaxID=43658 RepID=A0A8T0BZZ9_9GAMM|nr:hypothetical protein PRUB_b0483 [Pseudoalteromonas rubra]